MTITKVIEITMVAGSGLPPCRHHLIRPSVTLLSKKALIVTPLEIVIVIAILIYTCSKVLNHALSMLLKKFVFRFSRLKEKVYFRVAEPLSLFQ